jgi:starch synthase
MVHQKGLDFVAEVANDIVESGGQIAILGLGDPEIEHMLSCTSRRHRDNIGVLIGFNEPMARRIVAGSDFTLMPSRFEPCGLTQMHAQRYGALPIAHATGGLADTIDDGMTGFLFSTLSSDGLMAAWRPATVRSIPTTTRRNSPTCAERRWRDALAGRAPPRSTRRCISV